MKRWVGDDGIESASVADSFDFGDDFVGHVDVRRTLDTLESW